MENIFFLILVAVVGLIRWLSQAAENKKNAEAEKRGSIAPGQPAETLAPRGAPQTEEERIRKFLEALGVPTSSDPPPRVQPRQVTPQPAPKRTILPVDPFPKPRGRVFEPSPPVTPPLPVPPALVPQPTLLPTRETAVLASPRQLKQEFARPAEFEVRNLGEELAEDAYSHAGIRLDGGKAPAAVAAASFVARLATEQGLRDAIVLREIFGPPRSMQPLDRSLVS